MNYMVTFCCPNFDCHQSHEWPRCVQSNNHHYGHGFPVHVCPECKSFIEIHGGAGVSSYEGCCNESFTLNTRILRDYVAFAPPAVRDALEEAILCHRASAWTGCIALARKTVEIIATEVGGKGKSLFQRLKDIKDRGLVAETFVHMDHYVRNLGNLAVHYDPSESKEYGSAEADCALAYAYEVSKRIFLGRKVETLKTELEQKAYLEYLDDPNWYRRYGIEAPQTKVTLFSILSAAAERPSRRRKS